MATTGTWGGSVEPEREDQIDDVVLGKAAQPRPRGSGLLAQMLLDAGYGAWTADART